MGYQAKNESINLRVTKELKKRLEALAEKTGVRLGTYVNEVLRKHTERKESQ